MNVLRCILNCAVPERKKRQNITHVLCIFCILIFIVILALIAPTALGKISYKPILGMVLTFVFLLAAAIFVAREQTNE